jgi:hypothetical protein
MPSLMVQAMEAILERPGVTDWPSWRLAEVHAAVTTLRRGGHGISFEVAYSGDAPQKVVDLRVHHVLTCTVCARQRQACSI